MILRDAVIKANEKYFVNATSDVDYMNAVMMYYKEYLFVMKMAIGGFQTELNNITKKYANSTGDAEVLKWAGEIKKLFEKKKVIKNPNFDPIEYLAVNYIAGHHGAANWAELAEK